MQLSLYSRLLYSFFILDLLPRRASKSLAFILLPFLRKNPGEIFCSRVEMRAWEKKYIERFIDMSVVRWTRKQKRERCSGGRGFFLSAFV